MEKKSGILNEKGCWSFMFLHILICKIANDASSAYFIVFYLYLILQNWDIINLYIDRFIQKVYTYIWTQYLKSYL